MAPPAFRSAHGFPDLRPCCKTSQAGSCALEIPPGMVILPLGRKHLIGLTASVEGQSKPDLNSSDVPCSYLPPMLECLAPKDLTPRRNLGKCPPHIQYASFPGRSLDCSFSFSVCLYMLGTPNLSLAPTTVFRAVFLVPPLLVLSPQLKQHRQARQEFFMPSTDLECIYIRQHVY